MVVINNKTRTIKVSHRRIKREAEKMLDILGYKDFDLGILLTTNATIRKFNREYRRKDKATDILSFPYHTDLIAGDKIKVKAPEDKNLGDIIISLEYVLKDAPRWGHSFDERLTVLLAHGIAHLLGHDHQTDDEFAIMNRLERKLLAAVI